MDNHILPPKSRRKVTLSCRVLPEQKLIIAERALELGMSPAQYAEAKILREDELSMEKKFEEQRQVIEQLKKQMSTKVREKDAYIEKLKVFYKDKMDGLQSQIQNQENQALVQNDSRFIVPFSDPKYLHTFKKKLQTLASKHGFDLTSVLKMCVSYTLENEQSNFFLERVSEFVRKNYSN